jgi:acid phosphatase type 7
MTPPPQAGPPFTPQRQAWRRPLLLLGAVGVVVLGVALRDIGAAPSWLSLGGVRTAGMILPIGEHPAAGEPVEPELAAAAEGKDDKKAKSHGNKHGKGKNSDKHIKGKDKADKHHKGKGNKHGKADKHDRSDRHGGVNAVAAAAATSLTFTPVADAQVSEASPTTNYGTLGRLLVDGGADPDVASYLRFDLSGVTAPVQRATLRVWVQTDGGSQNGPEVRVTGHSWSETELTWSNRPAPTGGVLDDKGALAGSTWVEYNVTSAVTGNGAVGFVLVPQSNDGAVFDSRQGANQPQLVLNTNSTETPVPSATATPTRTPTPTPTPTATSDPVVMAAGDNVCGAESSGASCKQMATSDLVVAAAPQAVLVLGDVQYECGEASDFTSFYSPSWGRIKARTHPSVGNHEYRTSTDPAHDCYGNPARAQAYFNYFGAAAGEIGKGYYSFDVGAWHLIALNSNCSQAGGCGVGSPQWTWLTKDLAAHPTACTLAYWHAPLYSSGGRATTATRGLYQALFDANADLVLTGHDHTYERFAPQNANGVRDDARGIRQFVVGTGGRNLTSWATIAANSQVRNNTTFGVLKLTLHPTSYDWVFVPIAGQSFTDTGTTACH